MSVLEWDRTGEHWFETGVDHGVLYPVDRTGHYGKGIVWNGLTSVNETPEGAEPNDQYADNIKYLTLRSAETFGATIEAFTYPSEFRSCDGQAILAPGVVIGQQTREAFGFCYRTLKGNDLKGQDAGYILHLVYGCTVSPSERSYQTVNDSPEAITFSWELDTTPVAVLNHKPTSLVTIDSTEVDPVSLTRLESVLYGTLEEEPRLPLPDELVKIMDTPISMFDVRVPAPDTQMTNRVMSDFADDIVIDDKAGTISGTVHKVRGWAGPAGTANITNYILPVQVPSMANSHVRTKLNSKDGGVLASLASNDGNTYIIVPKNHDGMKLTVQQSDTNNFTDDITLERVYDLSNVVYDETTEPVDNVTPSTTSTYIKTYMSDKHPEKTVDDLQSNLVLRINGASDFQAEGTLHNVEGFTSFYDKERPNGHFMIFRFAPKDTTHRIGVKSSEAKGGTDSVFEANDFIVLARVDDFMKQDNKALTVYEYDADGQNKLNTFQVTLDKLVLE